VAKKHLYATMTHEEVNEAVLERRVVLIPVGQLEAHGPRLPIDLELIAPTLQLRSCRCKSPVAAVTPPGRS
jgi:creatinine amidohydrolase/Fe(II)-dependent formamide hydrolase-like protein